MLSLGAASEPLCSARFLLDLVANARCWNCWCGQIRISFSTHSSPLARLLSFFQGFFRRMRDVRLQSQNWNLPSVHVRNILARSDVQTGLAEETDCAERLKTSKRLFVRASELRRRHVGRASCHLSIPPIRPVGVYVSPGEEPKIYKTSLIR